MKKGHTPIRMCMICRQRFAKSEIMRYVLPDDTGGALEPDRAQRKEGRGYYVCNSPDCMKKFSRLSPMRRKRKGV